MLSHKWLLRLSLTALALFLTVMDVCPDSSALAEAARNSCLVRSFSRFK